MDRAIVAEVSQNGTESLLPLIEPISTAIGAGRQEDGAAA